MEKFRPHGYVVSIVRHCISTWTQQYPRTYYQKMHKYLLWMAGPYSHTPDICVVILPSGLALNTIQHLCPHRLLYCHATLGASVTQVTAILAPSSGSLYVLFLLWLLLKAGSLLRCLAYDLVPYSQPWTMPPADMETPARQGPSFFVVEQYKL